MDSHKAAVAVIAERVKIFSDRQRPFRIYHGSTNSTRRSQYTRDNIIDTSQLSNVLKIDKRTMTALVEPNVPMDRLVEATLAHGLLPPVVMEFPGITAGGGFSGTSGESSSFRYGVFDQTATSVELVLGNGDVVTASEKENTDLFHGAASSFGTLGVVTLVELGLREAKPYVGLTYYPITGVADAIKLLKRLAEDKTIDYLDGILFSKDSGVICAGQLMDSANNLAIQSFRSPSDPWFYLHAQKLIRNGTITREAIPLEDYLFRYDRGAFWTGMYAFRYFMTPFNRVTRWALDTFMRTRVMYHALHKSALAESYIVQDVGVPYSAAPIFMEYLDESFGCYPLWLCPVLTNTQSTVSLRSSISNGKLDPESEVLLNFGIWGPGSRNRDAFVEENRRLELKVRELGGVKALYAHAYYTEDEFWDIYDRKTYDALRQKYHATHLLSIYDKVKVDVNAEKEVLRGSWKAWLLALFWSIWPFSGVYGVLHTLLRTEYLVQRSAIHAAPYKSE